jgi:meiotic recombination protein REC8, fungi type
MHTRLITLQVTQGKENLVTSSQTPVNSQLPPSPANSFAQLFLSQDEQLLELEPALLANVTEVRQNNANKRQPKKTNNKRTRLLLDARTELTNEEIKVSEFIV